MWRAWPSRSWPPDRLAAQLAIYLGYIRAGILGATAVGVAFVLPSFLMVLALSAAYVRFGGLPWMQGMFYGIGAAVIGIIARSAFKLTKLTLGKDPLLWSIFAVLAISTAWTSREIIWLFLLGGIVAMLVKAPPRQVQVKGAVPLLLPLGARSRTTGSWKFFFISPRRACLSSAAGWRSSRSSTGESCKDITGSPITSLSTRSRWR